MTRKGNFFLVFLIKVGYNLSLCVFCLKNKDEINKTKNKVNVKGCGRVKMFF